MMKNNFFAAKLHETLPPDKRNAEIRRIFRFPKAKKTAGEAKTGERKAEKT